MKKKCHKCNKRLDVSKFANKNIKLGTLQSHCRDCQRKYRRDNYVKRRKYHIGRVREQKRRARKWLDIYKTNLSCELCPENHPAALQFHHKDPSKKDLALAHAVNRGWSKERLLKEIAKCKVLCANCHAKEHYKQKTRAKLIR